MGMIIKTASKRSQRGEKMELRRRCDKEGDPSSTYHHHHHHHHHHQMI